jgi:toxin-antitoxin system PIN domain toxin
VIAVDSNILIYSHRSDASWHARALERMRELTEGSEPWALPWQCVHEFLCVVTHPRVYRPPTSTADALAAVASWLESPSCTLLTEGPAHWDSLRDALAASRATGAKVHDARIAALCRQHRVRELWSADRDFSRYPDLTVVNPLVDG